MRVGEGYDVHAFAEDRPLILGGVEVPHSRGLAGHSDADVLAHAVGDALLGALGAGDLGTHFPSDDEGWRGASGAELLGAILDRCQDAGFEIGNVDATIVAQEPRLASWREKIWIGLAGQLDVEPARVNVKLKSPDRLGAIGRGEGIAARAIVMLRPMLDGGSR